MNLFKRSFLSLALGVTALAQNAPAPAGGVFACSDGGGTVRLLWMPPAEHIPAGGWRIQDEKGKVLERLPLGDPAALAAVPKAEAEQARQIVKAFADAKNPKDRKLVLLAAFVKASQSPEMGKALALSTTLKGLAGSRQTFVVVGLDKAGNPDSTKLSSAPVDPSVVTPFPPATSDLKAVPHGRGMELFWSPVSSQALPVIDYRVKRDGTSLTDKPHILGAAWKPEIAQFVDREAGLEAEHTYEVTAVDIFGRRSAAATVRAYLPDPAALEAPGGLKAEAQPGRTILTWLAPRSRYVAGFAIERAFLREGPWENLIARPLPASATRFEDINPTAGSMCFYRIRSLNSQSLLGEPSLVVFARAKATDKLAAPTGLAAKEGTSRIRLTWNPAPNAIAGYYVERRVGSDHTWARLNPALLSECQFDDNVGATASGGFQYRVTAVDFDNSVASSDTVTLILEDTTPPPAPLLMQVIGNYGKVVLRFRAASPAERTAHFLVLRSQPGMPGEIVVGDPLPGNASEVTDLWVQPGQVYRYRLLALTSSDVRSEPSQQLEIRVGAPVLEAPPKPVAVLESGPNVRLTFTFPEPPEGVVYFLHRKQPGQRDWVRIAGPLDGTEARDVNPPHTGKVLYRLHAQSVDGSANRSGDGVEVLIP
jgi:hypothetical protein